MRIVFDTNTIVSALLFNKGQLAWLRRHWRFSGNILLVSTATIDELIRVLAYPKFRLESEEVESLLSDYLPYTTVVNVEKRKKNPICRDADDQMFVDLSVSGNADLLVTGDKDLLLMDLACAVVTAETYRRQVMP